MREALALVFERHRKINEKTKTSISPADEELLKSLGLYINDQFLKMILPVAGSIPSTIASLGMRRLNVDNYVVLYIVDETNERVEIVRIPYGAMDLDKFFENMT